MNDLRKWQRDFLTVFAQHDKQVFLLVAAVGAGKTRAGLAAFQLWAAQASDPLLVVVSPSLQILRGWAREAARSGKTGVANLDSRERVIQSATGNVELLSVDRHPPKDLRHWLFTYGSLLNLADVLDIVCARRDVFVILDEPHHAEGGDDPSAWGKAAVRAFAQAKRILCPTATPYRTRGTALPLIDYGSDNRARADFVCSRERAIREGCIRRLRFTHMDANVGWVFLEPGGTADDSLISGEEADMALRLAIKDDDYIIEMLERGKHAVDQRHREGFDGTMLVLADNVARDHARRIDEIANELWPGFSVRATGDDPDAHRTIDLFRERRLDARCLVTVGMAGEGCDIPHLVAECWLTARRSQLFFTQATGRITRCTAKEPAGMPGTIVLPAHPELTRLAESLMSEELPALRDVVESPGPSGSSRDPRNTPLDVTVEDIQVTAVTADEETYSIDREVDELAKRFGLPVDIVYAIRFGEQSSISSAADETAEALRLRERIHKNISRLVYRIRKDESDQQAHRRCWTEAKHRTGLDGRSLESMTTRELQRMDDVVILMLREAA